MLSVLLGKLKERTKNQDISASHPVSDQADVVKGFEFCCDALANRPTALQDQCFTDQCVSGCVRVRVSVMTACNSGLIEVADSWP